MCFDYQGIEMRSKDNPARVNLRSPDIELDSWVADPHVEAHGSNLDELELDGERGRSWRRSTDLPEMSGGCAGSGEKWTFYPRPVLLFNSSSWQLAAWDG